MAGRMPKDLVSVPLRRETRGSELTRCSTSPTTIAIKYLVRGIRRFFLARAVLDGMTVKDENGRGFFSTSGGWRTYEYSYM